MNTNKVFLDSKYVSNLVKKYKTKNKISRTIIIILVVTVLLFSVFAIFSHIKKDRYERYLNRKIDMSVDVILKETVKIKYSLSNVTKGVNVENSLLDIAYSTSTFDIYYKDLNNIMVTAMNEVGPHKIVSVTENLSKSVGRIYNQYVATGNISEDDMNTLSDFNKFYNEILYIQTSLVMKNTPNSTDDNTKILDIDLSSVSTIEESYQDKYCDGIKYTLSNKDFIPILVKIESFIVNKK